MENHMVPITMTKKIWNLVRVFLQLARKGISSKRKLLLVLNLLLRKGKIAGKALVGSLIFHHHHRHQHWYANSTHTQTLSTKSGKGEYEFSCSDTPAHHALFNNNLLHRRQGGKKHKKTATTNKYEYDEDHSRAATGMDCPELFLDEESYEAVSRVLETLALREGADQGSTAGFLSSSSSLNHHPTSNYSSPAYNLHGLGYGCSSRVRQLRVTDSPFPLANNISEDDRQVDEAAEDFINRFYSQLRQQPVTPGAHGGC